MRIIECNIDKFGVICNKKFAFSPDLNCILQENGTGKTSLCAFIKAMLYGIGDTKKASLDENDRKRYLPWSGGAAQGSLTFSVGGKVYRVERSFGAKASEDSFALYDVKSGLPSSDYTENLGCELFGIDRDGYEQTVYLSERALTPTGENKSVSAKLSDLVGADGDIGVMDDAMKILEAQRKFLQKKGGIGAISDIKRALDEKDDEISSLSRHEEAIKVAEERLAVISKELDNLKSERDALMKMQAESAKRELYLDFEEKCKQLLSEIEKEVAEKDALIQKFGGEIPERAYVDALRLDYAEAQKLLSSRRDDKELSGELRELSLLFASDSAECDITALSGAIADYRELSRIKATKEYTEVSELFSKRIPRKEECDEAVASLTAAPICGRTAGIISILIAIIALAALPLGIIVTPLFFAVSAASAIVTSTIMIPAVLKRKKARAAAIRRAEELIGSISGRTVARSELLTETLKISSLIDRAEYIKNGRLAESERTLIGVLYKYGKSDGNTVENAEALIRDYERYKLFKLREGVKLERVENDRRRAEQLLDGVNDAFKRLGIEFSGSFTEIYHALDRYRELSSSIIAKREQYTRYKTETKVDKISISTTLSGEETSEKIASIDASSKELSAEAGVLNLRLSELNRMLSERSGLICERGALLEKLSKYEENLAVVLKTKELLNKAKDNIQSKYLGTTEKAFSEYIEKISGVSGGEYRLDTDFNITKSEGGISRPAEAYSKGTRELYNLAARLALIDSLYEGESPFIILDDPFAYLDDEKMKNAAEVVKALADGRQIIYLTCTESRCIKNP